MDITINPNQSEALREKLGDLFVSIEKNISVQTKTLRDMYDLQKDSFLTEKNRIEDQKRADRFAKDEDNIGAGSQTPNVKGNDNGNVDGEATGKSVTSFLSSIIGGISVPAVLAGIGVSLLATVARGYIERLITTAFGEDTDGDGEGDVTPTGFKMDLLDAVMNAGVFGFIGTFLGRRVRGILAVGAFFYTIADRVRQKLEEGFGVELNDDLWSSIGALIGGAIALVLPGMIARGLARGFAAVRPPNPNSRGPSIGAGGGANANANQNARSRLLQSMTDDALEDNGIRRTFDGAGRPRYTDMSTNRIATNDVLNRVLDQVNEQKLQAATGRLRLLMRGLMAAGFAYSAYRLYDVYNDPNLSSAEKTEQMSTEIGALLGGAGGAALAGVLMGVLGTSIGPWGTALGLVAGGAAGGLAGGWLAGQMAEYVLGSGGTDPLPADISAYVDQTQLPSGEAAIDVIPRPTGQEEGDPYGIRELQMQVDSGMEYLRPTLIARQNDLSADQAEWDRIFGGSGIPARGGLLPLSELTLRPDQIQTLADARQTAAPEETLPSIDVSANPTYEEILAAMQEANLVGSAAPIVMSPDNRTVNNVTDNRSTSYFISNGGTINAQGSLNPFFN